MKLIKKEKILEVFTLSLDKQKNKHLPWLKKKQNSSFLYHLKYCTNFKILKFQITAKQKPYFIIFTFLS